METIKATKINFLTRWKIQLDTNDPSIRAVALSEIIEMLNSVSEEKQEEIYLILINSDICHFISEITSYRDRKSMGFINKIVSHLSEIDDFFKNEFYKVFKAYLRVINSFPVTAGDNQKHQTDIFICMITFITRARERDCNFNDPRISFNSILGVMSSLSKIHFVHVPVLKFLLLMIEMLRNAPAKDDREKKFREEKLFQIVEKLNVEADQLKKIDFALATSNILHKVLMYIKDQQEKLTSKTIHQALVEKLLAFMEFTLMATNAEENYEMLCNILYYFLTSPNLMVQQKLQLLNYFFSLDGHNKITTMMFSKKGSLQSKSRALMAEVMSVFMKFMSKSPETDETWKRKAHDIVFKELSDIDDYDGGPSSEEAMMYIFLKFIDFAWKKSSFDEIEVLSQTSTILAVMKTREEKIEPTFFNLLTTLFTATFVNVKIKGNELLKTSSEALLHSIKSLKTIDMNFLKWWKVMGKPKANNFNQKTMEFVAQKKLRRQFKLGDSKILDKQMILQTFLDPPTKLRSSKSVHSNLKNILFSYSDIGELTSDFEKLLEKFKNLRAHKKERRAFDVMDVIIANIGSIKDSKLKKKTATYLMMLLKDPSATQQEKIATIEAVKNLHRSM